MSQQKLLTLLYNGITIKPNSSNALLLVSSVDKQIWLSKGIQRKSLKRNAMSCCVFCFLNYEATEIYSDKKLVIPLFINSKCQYLAGVFFFI